MGLRKIRLGDYIELIERSNKDLLFGEEAVRGVNNKKEIILTKANMDGRDLSKFSIVRPGEFFFNHRTSRNGGRFSITYNYEGNPFIVTEDYVVFRIKNPNELLVEWLYMYFNRPEFDRYVVTNSWGSSTEFFNWEDICQLELELPDVPCQKKFVDLFLSLIENQGIYERNLLDLKLVCDAYIEEIRRNGVSERIGPYIECTDRKTDDPTLAIKGISNQRCFGVPNSRVDGVETSKYLRIGPREFGYSPIHINDGSIAFNDSNDSFLLSPIYKTFRVINEKTLLPEYLMMWFQREEFTRYCWFHAFGSARDTFEWDQMREFRIPIPEIKIQKAVTDIYKSYLMRKTISDRLKEKIADICPLLIKGSIEEAGRS